MNSVTSSIGVLHNASRNLSLVPEVASQPGGAKAVGVDGMFFILPVQRH